MYICFDDNVHGLNKKGRFFKMVNSVYDREFGLISNGDEAIVEIIKI